MARQLEREIAEKAADIDDGCQQVARLGLEHRAAHQEAEQEPRLTGPFRLESLSGRYPRQSPPL